MHLDIPTLITICGIAAVVFWLLELLLAALAWDGRAKARGLAASGSLVGAAVIFSMLISAGWDPLHIGNAIGSLGFEAWLTLGALVTGIFWVLDKWLWSTRREEDEKVNWAVELARSFFPVLLVVLLLRAFVVEPFRIPSRSMVPTLLVGDFILVNKFEYGLRLPVTHTEILDLGEPERGDVMVFRYPEDPSVDYIKRVIGLPGDKIAYRDNQLYINGKPVPYKPVGLYTGDGAPRIPTQLAIETLPGGIEHPILDELERPGPSQPTITVPADHFFVMGDNRDNSADSRVWGFVPKKNLIGEAFMIWLSVDWSNLEIRWSRIGSSVN